MSVSDGASKKIDVVSYCRERDWKQKVQEVFYGALTWEQYYKWCVDTFNTLSYRERREFAEFNGY